MRFHATAALSAAALLARSAHADAQSVLSEEVSSASSAVESATSATAIELPTFTVSTRHKQTAIELPQQLTNS